jgi:xyloglucan-specific exo-beta-1,4-glucanase
MNKMNFSIHLILLMLVLLFGNFLPFGNNTFAQEEEKREWFFRDRSLPYDSIPPDAYTNAVEQQWQMRQTEGYILSQPLSWTSIGPTPVNPGQYSRSGRVVRVKYDPTDENVVYICGHNGGVWKSTNAQDPPSQVVFNPITDGLKTQSSGDIAIDPQRHNTIYYGTGGNVFCFPHFNYYGIGVYKSTDGGNSWSGPYTSGLPALIFTCTIAVNPSTGDVYLADGGGTDPYGILGSGLYKSTDGGVNWSKVVPNNSTFNPCYDVAFSNNGQNVYVTASGQYWRSTDYGVSFSQQDPSTTGFTPVTRTQISVSQANDNYVYALTRGNTNMFVYTSADGGNTFPTVRDLGSNYDCMSLDFMFVQASPLNSALAFVGYGTATTAGLWRTSNAGQNFSSISAQGADHNNFAYNPSNSNQGIICCDFGIWISNDIQSNVNWSGLNNTLSLTENYRIASNPFDPQDMVIGVEDAGFFKYQSGTAWYETISGCDGTNVIHSRASGSSVYIASKGACNYIYSSTDAGISWNYPQLTWSYWDGSLDWIGGIAEKPDALGTFYHPRRNANNHQYIDISVTTNNGANWGQNTGNISQINTQDQYGSRSPQWISICEANPQVIYVSTKWWLNSPPPLSQVFMTSDGGNNWINRHITDNGIPNRVVTSVVADPIHDNVVYLTLSGFGSSHVFKSTNRGINWHDISNPSIPPTSGFVPNLPANYLIVRTISPTQNQLIIGTDAGVYSTLEPDPLHVNGFYWQEVAQGLPNTICLGLDYNLWSNKLRAALFGRGVWEVQFPGPVYVNGSQTLGSTAQGLNISDDIVVDSGATLNIPSGCTIKMPADKKIIIEDGGMINITSSETVTFTSQSGSWGGIEIQGSGGANLKNISFANTTTPITINECVTEDVSNIVIDSCSLSGPISITSRNNVEIKNCSWSNFSNSCIISSGSNNLSIHDNNIAPSQAQNTSAIDISYGEPVTIVNNTISGFNPCLNISNASSASIENNILSNSPQNYATYGISLTYGYSNVLNGNSIIGFETGVKLYNSSPTMYDNTIDNSDNSVYPVAVLNEYNSYPRLRPTVRSGEYIWDAGKNHLFVEENPNNQSTSFYLNHLSLPDVNYGYNDIKATQYYIRYDGSMGLDPIAWNAECNYWLESPPQYKAAGNFDIIWDQYDCELPGGASYSNVNISEVIDPEAEPLQPIIVNRGNGLYDTIKVTSGNPSLTADKQLYFQGFEKELLADYSSAITKYQQVIQNYRDSLTAINSLKRILNCTDKLKSAGLADTSAYSALSSYYYQLASANPQDTSFSNVSEELAIKCKIRLKHYTQAISEYENVISNTTDTLKILGCEINIIEAYMLLSSNEGDANSSFTGKLQNLKPLSIKDGFRMIRERMIGKTSNQNQKIVPKQFSLSQNYPNPFNPLTKINYSLPQGTKVSIKIYDILGKLVKELVNEYKEAGTYTVTFDGSNFASGVYFYKIEAGKFIQTKKMVLIK